MTTLLKPLLAAVMVAAALPIVPQTADAQYYYGAGRMTWTGPNSYIYDATSYWRRPPVYYSPYYGGYYGAYRPLPPYGFGNPYYTGYNDPYYGSYGPGVREFLRFGGADFYGW